MSPRSDKTRPISKSWKLVPANGGQLPEFTAGAHIDVFADGDKRRSYSLANNPKERHRYVIGVLREIDSRGGSIWMHENLKVGDTLKVTSPLNNFELAKEAAEYILIAGGIGITPMLSMGYRLKKIGAKYTLHYCTKSAEQTAFMEDVKKVFGNKCKFHHDGRRPQ